jgi:hypothetical protein
MSLTKLSLAESLVNDIPAGDGEIDILFYSVYMKFEWAKLFGAKSMAEK